MENQYPRAEWDVVWWDLWRINRRTVALDDLLTGFVRCAQLSRFHYTSSRRREPCLRHRSRPMPPSILSTRQKIRPLGTGSRNNVAPKKSKHLMVTVQISSWSSASK